MSKKILALATMAALTGLAGTAKAGEVPPILDSVTGAQHQDTHLVMLTETQMKGITAGHLYEPPANMNTQHKGWYWINYATVFGYNIQIKTFGMHKGCGAARPAC